MKVGGSERGREEELRRSQRDQATKTLAHVSLIRKTIVLSSLVLAEEVVTFKEVDIDD